MTHHEVGKSFMSHLYFHNLPDFMGWQRIEKVILRGKPWSDIFR